MHGDFITHKGLIPFGNSQDFLYENQMRKADAQYWRQKKSLVVETLNKMPSKPRT